MLNKKSIKVISIVLLAVVLLATVASTISAAAVTVPTPSDVNTTGLDNTVSSILGIIRWAGIVIAVIIAMFLGIKYITASPDGKAEIKKTLALYVGGIALLLSASVVVTIIQNALPSSGSSNGTNP